MRILLSNDDGIQAPGLQSLIKIARALSDDVWVVAPETNHSGAGHSLTLRRPLRLREVAHQTYAVDGTPTDSVLVAMQHVLRDKPVDLMLSGVNHGGNLAEDISYSGTVSAAKEAAQFGVRAIAMSQVNDFKSPVKWGTAEAHGVKLVERLLAADWASSVLMNVNFPDVSADQVTGLQVTTQGQRAPVEQLDERRDPFGYPYYWIGVLRADGERAPGSDLRAVRDGAVSITPIKLDLTAHELLPALATSLAEPA